MKKISIRGGPNLPGNTLCNVQLNNITEMTCLLNFSPVRNKPYILHNDKPGNEVYFVLVQIRSIDQVKCRFQNSSYY